jgi:alpha-tubulin suppressor-like RCC1 family protein
MYIILEKKDKKSGSSNTLIFCYGALSSYLHLQKLSPSIPLEMRSVKQVSLGEHHCIMLIGDGTLWGVGSN